jgi:hypothetical protein
MLMTGNDMGASLAKPPAETKAENGNADFKSREAFGVRRPWRRFRAGGRLRSMVNPRADESGAEATAVQTLREFEAETPQCGVTHHSLPRIRVTAPKDELVLDFDKLAGRRAEK